MLTIKRLVWRPYFIVKTVVFIYSWETRQGKARKGNLFVELSSYCGCERQKKLSKALKELLQVFLATKREPLSIALAPSAGQVHALSPLCECEGSNTTRDIYNVKLLN